MTKNIAVYLIYLFVCIFVSCTPKSPNSSDKLGVKDPFEHTIVKSQFFEINSKIDTVIQGKNGTTIVCPKGCFVDAQGKQVTSTVKIELSEALTLHEMLLSNLTTTSDGKPLETDGMIYFNVTAEERQIFVNKNIPIHIEIPTKKKKSNMKVYEGRRDEYGNMNWIDPKEIDNFLVNIDLNELDFLPKDFAKEVERGLPFKTYTTLTPQLADSLYYQLDINDYQKNTYTSEPVELNEPYLSQNNENLAANTSPSNSHGHAPADEIKDKTCGINPLLIKIIKSIDYQNTFIATREFESRLKVIHKACSNEALKYYINNLDKNLFEVDRMVADLFVEKEFKEAFMNFFELKQTKIKNNNPNLILLKKHLSTKLKQLELEVKLMHQKYQQSILEKNAEVQKVSKEYKELLFKRESVRMESYGFDWTKTGWINIDKGIIEKDWNSRKIERLVVVNSNMCERIYTYIVFTNLKSINRLNTKDNVNFYAGIEPNFEMLMPKSGPAIIISIGYKDNETFIGIKEIELSVPINYELTIESCNKSLLIEKLKTYESYGIENSISKDLEYMEYFFHEKIRQKALIKESEFLHKLRSVAFPCCKTGKELFSLCSGCHYTNQNDLVGPGLANATKKHTMNWLYSWTINSTKLIQSGDKEAVAVYHKYNEAVQPYFNLTQDEVVKIFEYVDAQNK